MKMERIIYQAVRELDENLFNFRFGDTVEETMSVIGAVSFTKKQLEDKVAQIGLEAKKEALVKKLLKVFTEKREGLKLLVIDQPELRGNKEAIEEQLEYYAKKYDRAKRGVLHDDQSPALVIQLYEAGEELAGNFEDLINDIKKVIFAKIEAGEFDKAEELINIADEISIGKDGLTPEKLSTIKAMFAG